MVIMMIALINFALYAIIAVLHAQQQGHALLVTLVLLDHYLVHVFVHL